MMDPDELTIRNWRVLALPEGGVMVYVDPRRETIRLFKGAMTRPANWPVVMEQTEREVQVEMFQDVRRALDREQLPEERDHA
jgi:hypothetical protein